MKFTKKRLSDEILNFSVHLFLSAFVSTIIGVTIASLVGLSVRRTFPTRLSSLLLDVPYSPLIWGTALLTGLWTNKRLLNRSAIWVGFFGMLAFVSLLFWDVSSIRHVRFYQEHTGGHYWKYEYEKMLAVGDGCGGDECFGKLLVTTPTLNCIAYSFGAWLALRYKHRASQEG